MRAIVAAMTAVVAATALGALASRAHATGNLIGMPPIAAVPDKNSTAALKQLLQDTKSGAGAKLGPHLAILQKAGLVTVQRVGQWNFFKRNEETYRLFLEHMQAF